MAYTYFVRRNGAVLFHTETEGFRYPTDIERGMQEAGCEIVLNGKRLRRLSKSSADSPAPQKQ